jgi:tRNA threonylcarbamoyladenosine biosynthesis protein TsaB
MRILALETSGTGGSVAALETHDLLHEATLPLDQRSAQSLAPAIDRLLREIGWDAAQIDLIAVTEGPGSFTGLRIGVTTAKALAYAAGAQVMGVNTLEVIARQAPDRHKSLWAVLDAQRGELFTARFWREEKTDGSRSMPVQIAPRETWLAQLGPGDAVSGPGLERLAGSIGPDVIVVEESLWQPQAATVGRLGYEQFSAGRRDDVFQLAPLYFRRAAAEEQWELRHGLSG